MSSNGPRRDRQRTSPSTRARSSGSSSSWPRSSSRRRWRELGLGVGLALGAAIFGLYGLGFLFATIAAGLATCDVDLARDPDRHARLFVDRSRPRPSRARPDQEGHAARPRAGDPRGEADPERTEGRWRRTRTTARPSRYAARSRRSAISWPRRSTISAPRSARPQTSAQAALQASGRRPGARRRVLPGRRSRRDDEDVARRGREESDKGPRRAVLLRRAPLTRPLARRDDLEGAAQLAVLVRPVGVLPGLERDRPGRLGLRCDTGLLVQAWSLEVEVLLVRRVRDRELVLLGDEGLDLRRRSSSARSPSRSPCRSACPVAEAEVVAAARRRR